uniref:Uncharacterized protein n=1 Tax=Setaria italica TaxID=4555 RepID=K3YB73_SETIT
MAIDIGAMYGGGTCCNISNKETKAAYSTRTNHSKAFHYRIAFDMAKITKSDKYKLKNLISVPFRPVSLTVPIGDGYHEFSVCNITTHSK